MLRVDFGIARESLTVSPSLAPASSNSSLGMITAMELPTLLSFPVNTRDMGVLLLRNNYISMASKPGTQVSSLDKRILSRRVSGSMLRNVYLATPTS